MLTLEGSNVDIGRVTSQHWKGHISTLEGSHLNIGRVTSQHWKGHISTLEGSNVDICPLMKHVHKHSHATARALVEDEVVVHEARAAFVVGFM